MSWLKEKLQNVRELAAKPAEWIEQNKDKPIRYYMRARFLLEEAIREAEDKKNGTHKDS